MSPTMKYTLGRIGLFVLALAVMWPLVLGLAHVVPLPFDLTALGTLLLALIVSSVASYFLLRRWREEMVGQIDGAVGRRRQRREDLRAALAGEDEDGVS
jgi:membrane protein implicated in regulation of membrane protease activity